MGNATYLQTNFTAGQISPLLYGRSDLGKFYNGVAKLENCISTKHGPVKRRPGTKFVAETKSSKAGDITTTRLIPFQFSTDQSYQLEFGNGYVRIFLNRGRLQDDGTVKALNLDADDDSAFELGSPYHYFSGTPFNSAGTHVGITSGSIDTAPDTQTYNATEGEVTLTFATAHGVGVGNIIKVSDETTPDNEVEGVFPVLSAADATTLTYAKSEGGATSTTLLYEAPDLATITTATAHGLSPGQYVVIQNITPKEYTGTYLVERTPSATQFVYRLDNGGTSLGNVTSNGFEEIQAVDVDVDKLDYKQSADVLILTHPNVKPKELQRKSGFKVISGTYDSGGTGRATLVISTGDSPHAFQANSPTLGIHSKVIISGCIPAQYNGCYTIETVTKNSISYTPDSAPGGSVTTNGVVDGWQIVDFVNQDGPYLDQSTDTDNFMSAVVLAIEPDRLTTTIDTFSMFDPGRVFRHKDNVDPSNDTWGVIRWWTSATEVYYEKIDTNPDRNPIDKTSKLWSLGAWSTRLGWPRTVGFIQGRSVFGGNAFQGHAVWTSESNNIDSFEQTDYALDTVNDNNAISLLIDDDQVNTIHWLTSVPQGLLIGTEKAEYLFEGRAKFDPITPTNSVVSVQSYKGSKANVLPVRAGNSSILFVQNAGRKIYQTVFNLDTESLVPTDITQLSENITVSGVDGMAFQQEPDPIIWAYLGDGTLIGCTYETKEEVIAWHKHPIGGTDAKVKSISTISDTSGDVPTDQLWMVVSRTIDGGTKEYIEYMEDAYETGDSLEDAKYVDSMVTYDGAATETIDDLDHLEGETVKVLGDGVAQSDKTVASGSISIDSASKVQIGLGYTSKLTTLPLEVRQAQPESNRKVKRMERAHVLFLNSQGDQFGPSESELEDVPFDDTTTLHSSLIEDMLIQSAYEREQQLSIVNSSVFPSTIRSITIEAEVQPIQN